jgi:hypothetical protein
MMHKNEKAVVSAKDAAQRYEQETNETTKQKSILGEST